MSTLCLQIYDYRCYGCTVSLTASVHKEDTQILWLCRMSYPCDQIVHSWTFGLATHACSNCTKAGYNSFGTWHMNSEMEIHYKKIIWVMKNAGPFSQTCDMKEKDPTQVAYKYVTWYYLTKISTCNYSTTIRSLNCICSRNSHREWAIQHEVIFNI